MRHVINHQVVLSQAPEGPLATWLDRFADAASRQGYTRSSICRRIRLAAGFSRWLGQEGIDPELHQLRASSAVSAIPHPPRTASPW